MTGAIIQARIGSTRLPKKVVKKIQGITILEHVVNRAKRIKNCNKVILATTKKKEDDVLEEIGKKLNISVFRGSKDDVLDRYYQAARLFKIDSIVRVTGDCPFLDHKIAEKVIDSYLNGDYDYVSNIFPPTFPDGLDIEVFSFKTLEKNWQKTRLSSEREHVTSYIIKHPKMFKIGNITLNKDFNYLRLTIDEKDDLILARRIYQELYNQNPLFGLEEIIKLFDRKPGLIEINQHINRNEGYLKSIKKDEKV